HPPPGGRRARRRPSDRVPWPPRNSARHGRRPLCGSWLRIVACRQFRGCEDAVASDQSVNVVLSMTCACGATGSLATAKGIAVVILQQESPLQCEMLHSDWTDAPLEAIWGEGGWPCLFDWLVRSHCLRGRPQLRLRTVTVRGPIAQRLQRTTGPAFTSAEA